MSTERGIERHELHKAYQLIFGEDPRGAGVLLEREALARTFRERAYQFRPDRSEELGRPRKELQAALKAVALAFDLLADVVGEQDRVWIMPFVDDNRAQPVRPWSPRKASASSVKVHARKANGEVEEATKRIKEAIGKLKAQTEALAKGRPAPAKTKSKPAAAPKGARKPLILGRHLHRRGLITLRQLIAAVAWQRAQRPAVGQIAKSWGILTDEQIFEVIQDKDQGELFCDYAVRKGLMTPFQRLAVVGRQRVMQKPIGSYFVEQGILSEDDIDTEVKTLQSLRSEDSSEKR